MRTLDLIALFARIHRFLGVLGDGPKFSELCRARDSALKVQDVNPPTGAPPFFSSFCNRNVIHISHSIKTKQPYHMVGPHLMYS